MLRVAHLREKTLMCKMIMTSILVWILFCFTFIANGCLISLPSEDDLYVETFQLLEDPNSMLLTIIPYVNYNKPSPLEYCKILNVNDGSVSDVVSCNQNTREWPIGDIDPSNTSITSATDNHDG
eukprot:928696_1